MRFGHWDVEKKDHSNKKQGEGGFLIREQKVSYWGKGGRPHDCSEASMLALYEHKSEFKAEWQPKVLCYMVGPGSCFSFFFGENYNNSVLLLGPTLGLCHCVGSHKGVECLGDVPWGKGNLLRGHSLFPLLMFPFSSLIFCPHLKCCVCMVGAALGLILHMLHFFMPNLMGD